MEKIRNKRIGIDARFYGPIGKGLGRYIQEIVDHITREEVVGVKFVVFLGRDNYDLFDDSAGNVEKVYCDIPWYSWREQIFMPWMIFRHRIDLMHFPHFNVPWFVPCHFVVTIHDLILTHFPTPRATTLKPFLYRFKNLAYRATIKLALMMSEHVITVSNFTRDDVISQFGVRPDKISVTYEGVSAIGSAEGLFSSPDNDIEVMRRYGLPSKFFLYVGNAYPHKNLEKMLEIFSVFRNKHQDISLVMVGKHDYFYLRLLEKAKTLNLWQPGNHNTAVYFPGYVPDQDLRVLYRRALAYLFPSLYEGFGLPPLEAMSFSCPVLSSDRGSLPEVLGEAALFANPESAEDMLAKMEVISGDDELRARLILSGRERVKKFDWGHCAQETLTIYLKYAGK